MLNQIYYHPTATRSILISVVLIVLVICSTGCNRDSNTINVQVSPATSSITAEKSTFCMPVEISLSELEKIMNKKIKQNLITDKELDNNFMLSAQRAGDIKLKGFQNKALISVPVNVSIQKSGKFNFLNVDFKIEVQLLSDISIEDDWSVVCKSEVYNILWHENPEVKILGLEIDLRSLVEIEFNENRDRISKAIDEAVDGKINLRTAINKVWLNMQKPHNIIKKTTDSAFLFINPIAISYLSHTITPDVIEINLQSEAYFTLKGSSPKEAQERSALPKLDKQTTECNGFSVSLIANLSFVDLNKKINKLLIGQTREIEGYTLTFERTEFKPSGQDLYVKLKLSGSVNCEIAAIVGVNIDTTNQNIYGVLKEFEILEGDIELEIVNLILGDFVIEQINQFSGFNYATYLEEIPKLITKGIASGKSGDNWHPVLKDMKTQVQDFQISQEGIHLKVKGTGYGRIVVDKLKAGVKEMK